jgi:hypothetical protein
MNIPVYAHWAQLQRGSDNPRRAACPDAGERASDDLRAQLVPGGFLERGIMSAGCISAGCPGGYLYINRNGNIAPCVFFLYTKANIYELYRGGGSSSSLLEGEYFNAIRSWQDGYLKGRERMENLFLPCPMRDHYGFAHQLVTSQGAKPMDENAPLR